MSKSQGKRRRRVHTPEFKAETVELVRTGGRNVGQVARDLDLAESLVRGLGAPGRGRRRSRASRRADHGGEGRAFEAAEGEQGPPHGA